MNGTKVAKFLFLSALSVVTFVAVAMEKQVNRPKFVPRKITADVSQQKGKSGKQQKVLIEKKEAEKKRQEEANQILEKKAQEIAEADKFKLSVEKVKTPKYLTIDYEDTGNVVFEDVLPVSTQKGSRRPVVHVATPMMPAKHISHTNPMKLIIELDNAVENKDRATFNRILNDPIFRNQIKAFMPYSGAINEDTERLNKNISHVQKQIAEKEQEKRTKKIQPRRTNTNG